MIVLVHLQIPYSKYKICKSTLVGNQLFWQFVAPKVTTQEAALQCSSTPQHCTKFPFKDSKTVNY